MSEANSVLDWLLNSDPAIRWQVLRDLVHAPADIVSQERAKIAEPSRAREQADLRPGEKNPPPESWGARLLALQGSDGQWDGGACFPANYYDKPDTEPGQPWTSTLPVLQLLYEFGIDPNSQRVRHAIELVRDNCRWEHAGQPFFSGEVEPCINGRVVTLGTYFGQEVTPIVDRLLGEQLDDGGWNCEAERGSTRSSFHTTINVLEGLLAYEKAKGQTPKLQKARHRAEEYLRERKLLHRKSTGEIIDKNWKTFSFPVRWFYDILRALDYFRQANRHDPRLEEAIAILKSKQQPDGTWLLENPHPGKVPFELEDANQPSRWNTLRALRILEWHEK